jgi:DNA-binding CsgD family transcriptional regulator
MVVDRAQAFLVLASVRQARGDLPGAHALTGRARELIEERTDPGMLPVLLEETGRALGSGPRRRVEAAAPLTERELAVLWLLPAELSLREIGRELYVSINTVRTDTQAIYRKLGVVARAEAAVRDREFGLVPGSRAWTGSHLSARMPAGGDRWWRRPPPRRLPGRSGQPTRSPRAGEGARGAEEYGRRRTGLTRSTPPGIAHRCSQASWRRRA